MQQRRLTGEVDMRRCRWKSAGVGIVSVLLRAEKRDEHTLQRGRKYGKRRRKEGATALVFAPGGGCILHERRRGAAEVLIGWVRGLRCREEEAEASRRKMGQGG
ncbi:hypothetical protein ZWY2020_020673 [Hordeum vulgare]|nr:hypothetical protein ZWY2020_020671 [Hordeum vulgare]KAI4980188.1 hypothetical protein ZWY2020_020673 [Hordeum vulgare]